MVKLIAPNGDEFWIDEDDEVWMSDDDPQEAKNFQDMFPIANYETMIREPDRWVLEVAKKLGWWTTGKPKKYEYHGEELVF